jgi:hypothetical protein
VHHRLERVRARLGLRNRIELAAWAGHAGLYRPRPSEDGATDAPGGSDERVQPSVQTERETHPPSH